MPWSAIANEPELYITSSNWPTSLSGKSPVSFSFSELYTIADSICLHQEANPELPYVTFKVKTTVTAVDDNDSLNEGDLKARESATIVRTNSKAKRKRSILDSDDEQDNGQDDGQDDKEEDGQDDEHEDEQDDDEDDDEDDQDIEQEDGDKISGTDNDDPRIANPEHGVSTLEETALDVIGMVFNYLSPC